MNAFLSELDILASLHGEGQYEDVLKLKSIKDKKIQLSTNFDKK